MKTKPYCLSCIGNRRFLDAPHMHNRDCPSYLPYKVTKEAVELTVEHLQKTRPEGFEVMIRKVKELV